MERQGLGETDLLAGLNPEQLHAVQHTEGPLLIFAGAGSGKTRVLVHRVAHLIHRGVPPAQILCLTFTNKAAGEMKLRLASMLGVESVSVWAGTFHAFGAWLLRHEAPRIDYPRSFVIYDAADQKSLIGKCLTEMQVKKERGYDTTLAWICNMSKDTLRPVDDFPHELPFDPAPVLDLYERRKQECGAFDFGDLLREPCRLLAIEEVAQRYRAFFRYILVDEYQDTNMAQYTLLMHLVGPERNICVVGDDDQSIYGWRGADVSNILRFRDDFPGAKIVVLEQNYRSTQSILDAASTLIANNRFRAPKSLRSALDGAEGVLIEEYPNDTEEAQSVAYLVDRLIGRGVSAGEIGIFYRINALSRQVEESLVRRGIPYAVFGGMRFYERREIRDVLAYLRLLANPRDEEALGRIINTPTRGIGARTVERLIGAAREQGRAPFEVIPLALAAGLIKGPGARGLKCFLEVMEALGTAMQELDVAGLIGCVLNQTGLYQALKSEIDGADRIANVRELMASAEGVRDLGAFLEEKALISAMDIDPGSERVSVMTLHMSKGLEFEHVFILGCEEGLIPHVRSMDTTADIEEERRLLYVGITRAKRQATLSWARVRGLYGREIYQVPSLFLREIQGE